MHLFLREIPVCYMYFPKCSCNTKNQIDKNEEHMKQEPISTKIFAQQTLALG